MGNETGIAAQGGRRFWPFNWGVIADSPIRSVCFSFVTFRFSTRECHLEPCSLSTVISVVSRDLPEDRRGLSTWTVNVLPRYRRGRELLAWIETTTFGKSSNMESLSLGMKT